MDPSELLEARLPPLLERAAAQAAQVGAVFLLELTGEGGGRWTLDFKVSPPSVRRGDTAPPDATLRLAAKDLAAIVAEPSRAFELFYSGKLELHGDPAVARRLPALLALLDVGAEPDRPAGAGTGKV